MDIQPLPHQPAQQPPQADSAFTEFDAKTGFQTAGSATGAQAQCVQRTLYVSLFEAAFGCVKRVSGMQRSICQRCEGSGEHPGMWTLGTNCPRCLGRATPGCGLCQGNGFLQPVPPPCPACQGSGRSERRAWQVDVPIHPGTLEGTEVLPSEVRVHSSVYTVPRRFAFTIHIEKHPLFRLERDHLSVAVPISVWRWVQGGSITVPTLNGSTTVALPNRPTALLVKGQGWPAYRAAQRRGPLFVLPRIIYPEQLRDDERRMAQLLDVRSQLPEVQGWSRHVQAWVESPSQDLR